MTVLQETQTAVVGVKSVNGRGPLSPIDMQVTSLASAALIVVGLLLVRAGIKRLVNKGTWC